MIIKTMQALLLFIFPTVLEGSIRWLALDHYPKNVQPGPQLMCSKKYGLTSKQMKFCRNKFHWMRLVRGASSDTVNECQYQLKERPWNCLSVLKAPKYDQDLRKDTREEGFVYALSAVSLALKVANGCMAGHVSECICRHPKRHISFSSEITKNKSNIDEFLGCKRITNLGQNFARKFLDMGFRRKGKNIRRRRKEAAVNKHNVEVGLKQLKNGEEISCRCNGVTASCAYQFCHRRVVQLKKVAKKLLEKYDTAVKLNEVSTGMVVSSRSAEFDATKVYSDSILYLTDGPNHCSFTRGYQTVSRRQCVVDSDAENSCDRLCCRGYHESVIEVHEQCRCKFIYCCKVLCDTCKTYKKIYECS